MTKRLDVIFENGVFRPLEPAEPAEHQRAPVPIPDDAETDEAPQNGVTCYDLAKRAGLLGAANNLPEDLRTRQPFSGEEEAGLFRDGD